MFYKKRYPLIHNIKFITCLLLFIDTSIPVFCQKPPIKFGKIDKVVLETNIYPRDTSAEAVILCEYGRFDPNNFRFIWIERIKILKKEGTKWANMVLPTPARSDVKGITYNLENGEIVTDKLKSESIFTENVTENLFRTRITMPNVRVGSVVDVFMSFPGLPLEWRFQEMIPVVWSELILPPTKYVELQKRFVGYEPLFISEPFRWAAKDMPAFKSELYTNSPVNYLTQFEIEISRIVIPGYVNEQLTGTWGEVNQYFLTHPNFGILLSEPGLFLSEDIRKIREQNLTDEGKIFAIVELIKKNIRWDKNNQLYSSGNLGYLYRDKHIGNSADINCTLIIGLRKLGFKVYPAILSTRDHGYINQYWNQYWPTAQKFNYVIAYIEHNGNKYFLDATEKNNPAGFLPERCLNGSAFIIDESASGWINLPSDKYDIKKISGNFDLLKTGELKGKLTYTRQHYAAISFRDKYLEYNSPEEYYKNFEKVNPGILIHQSSVRDIDSIWKPVTDEYEMSILNRTSLIDDRFYIEPLLFLEKADNPFKPEKRICPVDFTVPSDDLVMINIRLPEGYSVSELPSPAIIVTPDKTAEFTYYVNDFGSSIQITSRFKIKKAIFLQNEYPYLREFYNMVINKQSEPVIIKKNVN